MNWCFCNSSKKIDIFLFFRLLGCFWVGCLFLNGSIFLSEKSYKENVIVFGYCVNYDLIGI